jgi:hypothetical protein
MKKQSIVVLMLLVAPFIFQSCSKDEVSASSSREIKYEMTGNFAGSMLVAATTNNGISEAIEIKKLPWQIEFTAKESIKSLVVVGTGSGGTAGQTATLKIFVGGKEVSTSTATALSGGIISINSDLYTLK